MKRAKRSTRNKMKIMQNKSLRGFHKIKRMLNQIGPQGSMVWVRVSVNMITQPPPVKNPPLFDVEGNLANWSDLTHRMTDVTNQISYMLGQVEIAT